MGDIKVGLNFLHVKPEIDFWVKRCLANKEKFIWDYNAPTEGVYAPRFIKEMSDKAPENTIVACDVGQHQMWVAQHYSFSYPHLHLTSGGLGTMGYGVPAAMGAKMACPEKTVVAVSGDGSILMNIQELATLKRYNIPIKIVLFDNKALGMVRQWQELFFAENYSEVDLSDNPDFVKVAEAFSIPAFRIERQDQVADAIDRMFEHEGPVLMHVLIDPKENVWPLVPPGKSNENMMEAKVKAI